MPASATATGEELRRISALRMQMLEMHPFWGYLLLQLRIVPAPDLPSFAATDGLHHIWFNPALTRHLDSAQLGFVLAHEVGHQLFLTGPRRAGRDRLRWNMATDYAINRIVADIRRPAGGHLYCPPAGRVPGLGEIKPLLDPKYRDMIAETIYEHLCQEELIAPRTVRLTLTFKGQAGGDGVDADIAMSDLQDHRGGIDIHLPDNLDDDQRELIRERLAAAIENWSANDKRGDVPGGLVRALGLLDKPRIPWQRLLHRFADQVLARDDYALARPNKRYLDEGFIVPGPYGERVELVVVALDTSASMSPGLLREVGRELKGIAAHVEEMILIVADAQVQDVVPFERFEEFLRAGKVSGGGGTDHRPVFEQIEKERLNPRLFIGLTDLFSRFPADKPPYPVLWVVPARHGQKPWGQEIEV